MSKRLELIDKMEVARRLCLITRDGEVSATAVDNAIYSNPEFPKPRKLGRFNRWIASEIDEYIAGLPTHEERKTDKPRRSAQ